MVRWENTPGDQGAPPPRWPADSRIARTGRATLVIAAHEHCPCTVATLREVAKVLEQSAGVAVDVWAVIDGAEPSDLADAASDFPWLHVLRDRDSAELRRFDGLTSGEVLLYGPDGTLRYHGGVTGGRGREGENAGASALLDALLQRAGPAGAPVYGCAIQGGA
jgi:hypothetical protein